MAFEILVFLQTRRVVPLLCGQRQIGGVPHDS